MADVPDRLTEWLRALVVAAVLTCLLGAAAVTGDSRRRPRRRQRLDPGARRRARRGRRRRRRRRRRPADPARLAPVHDSGDGLHLSVAGYRALADALDPGLLTGSPCLADRSPVRVLATGR